METTSPDPACRPSVIPSWMVPFLSLPFRRLWESPERIVLPLVRPGQRVLEIGPGSGFFTIPMVRAAGGSGRVFCIELQEAVRRRLWRTLERRGLMDQVEVRACCEMDLQVEDLKGSMDLAVAIHVLHEMPEPARAIAQIAASLRPGGTFLVREPKGHCSEALFMAEADWAVQSGLRPMEHPKGLGAKEGTLLFEKPL